MLKTIRPSNLVPGELGADDNEVIRGSSKADNRNLSKKSKNTKFGIQTYVWAIREPTFLTLGIKKTFNQLRQVFTKAPILQYFDPEYYIWIETDTLDYIIRRVLS